MIHIHGYCIICTHTYTLTHTHACPPEIAKKITACDQNTGTLVSLQPNLERREPLPRRPFIYEETIRRFLELSGFSPEKKHYLYRACFQKRPDYSGSLQIIVTPVSEKDEKVVYRRARRIHQSERECEGQSHPIRKSPKQPRHRCAAIE